MGIYWLDGDVVCVNQGWFDVYVRSLSIDTIEGMIRVLTGKDRLVFSWRPDLIYEWSEEDEVYCCVIDNPMRLIGDAAWNNSYLK